MTDTRAWLVVIGLSLGVCVSNGFARFAYGLILPAMRDDLGWSFAQAGWINTANALGYVAGAAATLVLIARVPPSRIFGVGLVATSVLLLLSGLTDDFWLLTLWRVLAGVSGAPAFIAGGVLAASCFPGQAGRNATAIALYFGGGGVGLVLSGAALPAMFAYLGPAAWPMAWIALGLASLLCCPISLWAAPQVAAPSKTKIASAPLPLRDMRFELAGYAFFATGYIVYLTFLVAWMRALAVGPLIVSLIWITAGAAIVLSPFAWRVVLARFRSGLPLALAIGTVAVGTMLPVILPSQTGLFLSAVLFGIAVFIGPSAVTNFTRQNLPQASWGRSIGLFTLVFAVGQTIGPVAAGAIGDWSGSIGDGLLCAGAVLCAGAGLALMQKALRRSSESDHPSREKPGV